MILVIGIRVDDTLNSGFLCSLEDVFILHRSLSTCPTYSHNISLHILEHLQGSLHLIFNRSTTVIV